MFQQLIIIIHIDLKMCVMFHKTISVASLIPLIAADWLSLTMLTWLLCHKLNSPWTYIVWLADVTYGIYLKRGIVDSPFRITNCRFLLAIVFRTWGLVCINLSFASTEFVCARSTHVTFEFCPSGWTPRFRESSCSFLLRMPYTLAVSAIAPS